MSFYTNITPHIRKELAAYKEHMNAQRHDMAFQHLENAHVLGQSSTRWHTIIHIKMASFALQTKNPGELLGQLVRIVGAATKTALGMVPTGNTGGTSMGIMTTRPLTPEHARIIAQARQK